MRLPHHLLHPVVDLDPEMADEPLDDEIRDEDGTALRVKKSPETPLPLCHPLPIPFSRFLTLQSRVPAARQPQRMIGSAQAHLLVIVRSLHSPRRLLFLLLLLLNILVSSRSHGEDYFRIRDLRTFHTSA